MANFLIDLHHGFLRLFHVSFRDGFAEFFLPQSVQLVDGGNFYSNILGRGSPAFNSSPKTDQTGVLAAKVTFWFQ